MDPRSGATGIELREMEYSDLETVEAWFADPETRRWLGRSSWAEQAYELAQGEDDHYALVGCTSEGEVAALLDVEVTGRRAHFAVLTDPARRRTGCAAAALAALETHPSLRGVHELEAGAAVGNTASERLLARCGYHLQGPEDEEGYRYWVRRLSRSGRS